MDKLGIKFKPRLIHKLQYEYTSVDTEVALVKKSIEYNVLRGFSTEIRETITTSF